MIFILFYFIFSRPRVVSDKVSPVWTRTGRFHPTSDQEEDDRGKEFHIVNIAFADLVVGSDELRYEDKLSGMSRFGV